ncbi:MAG: sensor histidine kinase [Nocardioidaceae bacterium]
MMLATGERAWTTVVLADAGVTRTPPDRVRQTILRILAGSLVALLVLLATGYVVGARLAEREALRGAERFTHLVGDTVIGPQLSPALLAGEPAAMDQLDRIVRERLAPQTSIVRIKVWGTDGTVLYSDDHADIGRRYDLAEELADLTRGTSTATVSDLRRPENVSERRLANRLVEVYTTVRAADGQRVLLEAYLSYDEVKDRRTDTLTMLAVMATVLLSLFALVQVWLSHVNLRWLRRRQHELDEQAEEVSALERRRLARDLHDGVVQDLVGTAFTLDGTRATVQAGDLEPVDEMLRSAGSAVRGSIQSLRSTLIEIYPPGLADTGLGQALDDLAQPLRARGVAVGVEDLVDRPLPRPVLEAAYRAAQEAVRNVGRHARATSLLVRVDIEGGWLRLVVRDDGVGFPPDRLTGQVGTDGHFGLRQLADTARERRGRVTVSSAPGEGSEIVWEVPLPQ